MHLNIYPIPLLDLELGVCIKQIYGLLRHSGNTGEPILPFEKPNTNTTSTVFSEIGFRPKCS